VILISHDRDFLDRVVTSVVVPEGDGRWTEYAGGYADMLAQRGAELARRVATRKPAGISPKTAEASPAEAAPSPAKRRLSFKDKHALETLPGEIATLEAKQTELSLALDDPGLFNRDRQKFTTLSEALADVQGKLAAAEERWLELELLRSEIEG
jgi:ATP-binding cassette subfamily F protein uup